MPAVNGAPLPRALLRTLKVAVARACDRLFPALWLRSRIWRRDRNFEREFFFLARLCDPERVSVDVGGNAGEFAYWLSFHSRHVYTYEPNPLCQRMIRRVLRRNTTLRPVALSDRAGMVPLVFEPGNTGIGSIAAENPVFARAGEPDVATVTVPTVRLDDDLAEPVGLIKIDVEGHEAGVIAGAVRTIARNRPRLMVEIEERHGTGAHERVRRLLQPLGYRRFVFADGGLAPLPWEEDAAAMQRVQPGTAGYVNNFIFVHEDDRPILAAVAGGPDRGR